MTKRFFGTDGIRGSVGKDPMTADFAMRLASAAAQVLVPAGGTVVIGKDTPLSGYMFESALEAGLSAAGADVMLLGPMPTPAIASSFMTCRAMVIPTNQPMPFTLSITLSPICATCSIISALKKPLSSAIPSAAPSH